MSSYNKNKTVVRKKIENGAESVPTCFVGKMVYTGRAIS